MSRWTRLPARWVCAVLLATAAHVPAHAQRYGFGQPASPEQIAGWDIDVRPDGHGLPKGRGTVAEGQRLYEAQCASCHGYFGESVDYLRLAGGIGSLGSDTPVRTTLSKLNHATTLFDYIRRAMPFAAPQSLSPDETYALTAYVLHLGDLLAADAALDERSILQLKLPNRDGFTTAHGLGSVRSRPDVRARPCMRDCPGARRITSALPEYARGAHGDLDAQMRPRGGLLAGRKLPAAAAAMPSQPEPPSVLVQRLGCVACHAPAQPLVGPSFRDLAGRYGGEKGVLERLARKVVYGSVGSWGQVPMPSHPDADEAQVIRVIQWILDGNTDSSTVK
jgi:cytochrome c551/c552